MLNIMKIFSLFFVFLLMLPQQGRAIDLAGAFENIPLPGFAPSMSSATEFRICQIRRLFCGTTGQVFVAAAIFFIGIMVVSFNLHWSVAAISIVGIVTFYEAVDLVSVFYDQNTFFFVSNPMCDCKCPISSIFDMPIDELITCNKNWGGGLLH